MLCQCLLRYLVANSLMLERHNFYVSLLLDAEWLQLSIRHLITVTWLILNSKFDIALLLLPVNQIQVVSPN